MNPATPRLWLLRFAIALLALTAVAVFADAKLASYRSPPHDFYAMQRGEYFDVDGLTRRQGGDVKLGFAETFEPPPIGAFGNHIIRYFGSEAFGEPEKAELFFNYSYANVSLPELVHLLRHLEARGGLPSELMIVSITPPNADNGHFIIDHGDELPPDLMIEDAFRFGDPLGVTNPFAAVWRLAEIRLHEVFNYNTLILGLSGERGRVRDVGPAVCPTRPSPRCGDEDWSWTLRRDGATNLPEGPVHVVDMDPLSEENRGLRAGDEREIARLMTTIDAIGRRNGVAVVFLVTPILETDRSDSVVNQVFDKALALAPDLQVIDHRGLHDDETLIVDSLHPTPAYYRLVAEELRARGLMDDVSALPLADATGSERQPLAP